MALLSLLIVCLGPQQAVHLKVNPKVGSSYRYRIEMKADAISAKGSFVFVTHLSEKLASINHGQLTWDQSFKVEKGEGKGVFSGIESSIMDMDGLKMQSVGTSTGDVKMIRMENIEVPSKGTSNVVFSPRPVKIGESWRAKIESSGQLYEIEYKLVALQNENGKSVAEIEGRFVEGQAIKTIRPMKVLVDRADGKLISANSEFEVKLGTVRMKASYSVTRC